METDTNDLLVATLARELGNDDRVFVGSNQMEVALAAYLARQLWAPRLKMWSAGGIDLDRGRDFHNVGRRGYDHNLVRNRAAFFWQARAFDEMGVRAPICFAGGLQVDSRGNANLAGVKGENGWRLRGPGSAGLPSLTAWAPKFYIVVYDHQPRVLVENCSQISVVGDPVERASQGMNPDSLVAIITPLARFEPTRDGVVLTETVKGLELDELRQRSGFEIRVSENHKIRKQLTDEEKRVLDELRKAADLNRRL